MYYSNPKVFITIKNKEDKINLNINDDIIDCNKRANNIPKINNR